jgi:hypothetical protein
MKECTFKPRINSPKMRSAFGVSVIKRGVMSTSFFDNVKSIGSGVIEPH